MAVELKLYRKIVIEPTIEIVFLIAVAAAIWLPLTCIGKIEKLH